MKTFYLIIVIALFFFSRPLKAQEKRDTIISAPMSINFQFAGNVGLASVGIGTTLNDNKLYIGIVYGYLPKSINNIEAHTLAAKAHFTFLKIGITDKVSITGYAGTNLNYVITNNTYLKYPDYFPDGYYIPNAIHLAPFIGQKTGLALENKLLEGICIYFELGTVDSYVANILESHQIPVYEIFNLCVGVSISLRTHKGTK